MMFNIRRSRKLLATSISALLLIVATVGCTVSPPVESPDSTLNPEPDSSVSSESTDVDQEGSMSIEGEITAVMESWPLQLTVDTETESYFVSLDPDTDITQGGTAVEASQLSPGQAVKISGTLSPSEENAMVAQSVEIK